MGLQDVAGQYLPLLSSIPGSTNMHFNLLVRLLLFSLIFFPLRQQNSVSSNEMRAIISSVRQSAKHVLKIKQEVGDYQFLANTFLLIFRLMPNGNKRRSSASGQCNL